MSILEQIKNSIDSSKTLIYQNRINYLKTKFGDVSHVEKGVEDVMKKINSNINSFVIYGEPQSGKTELMLALTCRLLDEGYENIFVVMNDNTSLENQNYNRFAECAQLDPQPIKSSEIELDDSHILKGQRHVIFCRKNAKNLEKIIDATRKLDKKVILDDEADFASPDNKVNKSEADASKINMLLQKLISSGSTEEKENVYIGVTATPGRLDLNNTFLNDSQEWVFVDPYPGYTGREIFFPVTRQDEKQLPYNLKRIPEENDSPTYLNNAILRFMLRNAYLNLRGGEDERQPYSMLIHTSGRVDDHEIEMKRLQSLLNKIKSSNEKIYDNLDKVADEIFSDSQLEKIGKTEILRFIYENRGKTKVLPINHTQNNQGNDTRAADPQAQFTFALGGNIISRGLTFNNLLSFFFTRNVKGKLQQNTYIQRARMFGNRKNLEFFELVVPKGLWGNWIDCFMLHELSLASAKAGDPVWFSNKQVNATDSAAIDRNKVDFDKGEVMVGSIFQLTDQIETILTDKDKDPIRRLEVLLEKGLITPDVFPPSYINIFKNIPNTASAFQMVTPEINGKERVRFIEPITSGDIDYVNLTRGRGGIIQSTINKISKYEHAMQLILPIRNESGACRFYYKSNIGMSSAKLKR